MVSAKFRPILIEAAAREWIGTPFMHQGRVKGESGGVDCAGLVVGVAHTLGLANTYADTADYSRIPDGEMETVLDQHLDRIAWPERQAGDVVHLAFAKTPQHVAILTAKDTIIHSLEPRGVVETSLGGPMHVRGVFRFRDSG